jgi:hypothetical protein
MPNTNSTPENTHHTQVSLEDLGFQKSSAKKLQKPKSKKESYVDEAAIAGTATAGAGTLYNKIRKNQALKKAPATAEEAKAVLNKVRGMSQPGDILFVTNPTLMPNADKLHPTMFIDKDITMDVHPGEKSDVGKGITQKVKNLRDKVSKPFQVEPAEGKLNFYATGQHKGKYSRDSFAQINGLYRAKNPKHATDGVRNILRMAQEPAGTYGYGINIKGRKPKPGAKKGPTKFHCVDAMCKAMTGKRSLHKSTPDGLAKMLKPVWENPAAYTKKPVIGPALAVAGATLGGLAYKNRKKNASDPDNKTKRNIVTGGAIAALGALGTVPKIRKTMMVPFAGIPKTMFYEKVLRRS